jgi:hypothetical protein
VNREVGVLLAMLRLAFERSRDDLIHELGSQLILDWGADPMASSSIASSSGARGRSMGDDVRAARPGPAVPLKWSPLARPRTRSRKRCTGTPS